MFRAHHTSAVALVVATLCLAPSARAQSATAASNQLSAADKKEGWVLLFNGKDLEGWRGYKRTDATGTRWVVEDGLLTLKPGDSKDTKGQRDIVSNATYDQFELSWEWRISPGGNSGVKYFVLEDRDAAIGHEYQVIDDERHADAKVGPKRQTAAFYDVLPASNRPSKPAGEWNQSRVIVKGKSVEHWLNGTKVLQYELASPALNTAVEASKFKGIERFGKPQQGHILLQDHGDAVWYRNIKIRPTNGQS
jgi:Domain of Unknown Function (DUF1080)